MRCEAEVPGNQLRGVEADIEWMKNGVKLSSSSNGRVTLEETIVDGPGREFRRSIVFSPLSAGDMGSYSCSATIRPTVDNPGVTNGFGIGSSNLTVAGKFNNSYSIVHNVSLLFQYPLWMSLSIVLVSLFESLTSLPSMASLSSA